MKRNKLILFIVTVTGALALLKIMTIMLLEIRLPQVLEGYCRQNGWVMEKGTVRANWFSWGFELRNLAIRHEPGRKHFDLFISSLRFDGFHPFRYWLHETIHIEKITLESGRLEGTATRHADSIPFRMPMPVRIGSVELQDFGGSIRDTAGIQVFVMEKASAYFAGLDFQKGEPFIDKAFDKCTFSAGSMKYVSADSLYTLAIDGMAYSASRQQLIAMKFRVIPNYENYAFTGRQKYQVDCIHADLYGVALENFPASHCFSSGSILAGLVQVDSMHLFVFRDRRKPDPHTPMPMVQQALYDLAVKLSIDSIVLGGGRIVYTEHIRETDRPSSVKFTEVKALCTGITNDTNTLQRWMHLETEALLLGRAPIRCSIRGKLFDPGYNLQIKGSVGSMKATAFNSILENSAPVKIKTGILDQLHFAFRLNAKQSSGTMKMLYHNLDLVANPDLSPKPITWAFMFIRFLGSSKILEANPLEGKQIREGEIGLQRDVEKSIFNYCLQSILSGSQSTLNKKPRKLSRDEA